MDINIDICQSEATNHGVSSEWANHRAGFYFSSAQQVIRSVNIALTRSMPDSDTPAYECCVRLILNDGGSIHIRDKKEAAQEAFNYALSRTSRCLQRRLKRKRQQFGHALRR